MKYCSECGMEISEGHNFCPKCGKSFSPMDMKTNTFYLENMDGYAFEKLCKIIFTNLNYGRIEHTPLVGDKGKDLIIYTDNGKLLVECKHHPTGTIGRPTIQKLHSAVVSEEAKKGIVVTSGKFSNGAISHSKELKPPIELIDKNILYDLSTRAGVNIKGAIDEGAVYTFPITSNELLKNNLSQHLEQNLISIPKKIEKEIKITNRKIKLKPVYVASYKIDAIFKTSVGIVHSENSYGTVFIDGTNGNFLDEGISNHFSEITYNKLINKKTETVDIVPFKLLSGDVKNSLINCIQEKHTNTVSYIGRNNQSYTKECIPKSKDILLTSVDQVYIPENKINFDLIGKNRYFNIADNGNYNFYVYEQNVSTCEICNRPAHQSRILCNECGAISHNKSFWKSHGFYCSNCGKSICRNCASYYSKFLILTKVLCKDCLKQKKEEGHKIRKFKPIC